MKTRTIQDARQIENDTYQTLRNAMSKLDDIHVWSKDESLNRDELWIYRARLQDALRIMEDLKPLRKDLK